MTEASTYAVSWGDERARFVGYAELEPGRLRLEGRGSEGGERVLTIPYDAIASVAIQRVNGSRGIALELADSVVVIASLDRPGSLAELVDRLRTVAGSPQR